MIAWHFNFLLYLAGFTASIMQQQIPPRPQPRQQSLFNLPPERKFIKVDHPEDCSELISFGKFRVLQFNMLADGLSGLRQDLGAFSRATSEDMNWEKRGKLLLHEILQYDPDVITLQECDHYYDCFLPELNARGYDGMFAPKPASACLEVSDSSDGCAIFVRRSKMFIASAETITYTLARADVQVGSDEDREPERESRRNKVGRDEDDADSQTIRAQNQVALILICELNESDETNTCADAFDETEILKMRTRPPPIIIATTHLKKGHCNSSKSTKPSAASQLICNFNFKMNMKASKTLQGEMYRVLEMNQLLATVERAAESLITGNRKPAIIITGDLNASPTRVGNGKRGYDPLAYTAVKAHRLNLRSLLNDDMIMLSDKERRIQREETARLLRKDKRLEEFTSLDKQLACLTELDIRAIREESQESLLLVSESANIGAPGTVIDTEVEEAEVWTTWKARKKEGGEKVVKHCIDYILYAPPSSNAESEVGARALGVLDLLGTDEVGPDFLPSSFYPSDHIAIAADLEIIGFMKKTLPSSLSSPPSAQSKDADKTDKDPDHSNC